MQHAYDERRAADLAARARQLRRTAGISFAAMAREAGVAPSTLSRWETAGPAGSHRARHWLAVLAVLDAAPGPAAVVAPTHRAPAPPAPPRQRRLSRPGERATAGKYVLPGAPLVPGPVALPPGRPRPGASSAVRLPAAGAVPDAN